MAREECEGDEDGKGEQGCYGHDERVDRVGVADVHHVRHEGIAKAEGERNHGNLSDDLAWVDGGRGPARCKRGNLVVGRRITSKAFPQAQRGDQGKERDEDFVGSEWERGTTSEAKK